MLGLKDCADVLVGGALVKGERENIYVSIAFSAKRTDHDRFFRYFWGREKEALSSCSDDQRSFSTHR